MPERYTPLEVLALYPAHDKTLWGLLESRAHVAPLRPFLLFQGCFCTYGDAVEKCGAIARSLFARGIGKGDRVAIMAANSDAYVLLLLALAKLGAIAVPVNPELNVADAGYILNHAGVTAVVCSSATLATARAVNGNLPKQTLFFVLDGAADSAVAFEELLHTLPSADLPAGGPDDTWLTLYTSGTTGFPKGVMHSQKNFVTAGEAFVERMHLQPDDRLFVVLPFYHINALFYSLGGALAAGASLLIAPRFSASAFWRMAAEGGATEVNIIGAVGNILLKRPRSEFVPEHRLRKIYGAGMSAETLEVFPREFAVPTLIEGYGLTEVPGVCNNPFAGPHKAGSIGPAALHPDRGRVFSEMRVLDDDGSDLPIGQTGEIAVKSPITMQGYYRDAEATTAAFRDGWFLTGDLGYRDADGYYYFVARKKDIIRRRGENISGAEIDRVVALHPKVLEAAAIAVPSELGEDEILIVAVPRPGQVLVPEEIADWCAERLAPWKQPRFFVQADTLPHTPTHRVAKFKLKEDAALRQRAVELQEQPMNDAFICDAVRTPFGRYGGALSRVRTDDLAAMPLRALLERNASIDPKAIDDVILGCTNQAGEDNRNVARMASLLVGLPVEVPGVTVNRLCASGMEAVVQAARAIQCDAASLILAGGVESMSRAPYILSKAATALARDQEMADSTLGWRFINPRMREMHSVDSLTETAENVAAEHGVSRGDQDAYAFRSQQRAAAAHAAGRFALEIFSVTVPKTKGEPAVVKQDEQPRPDTTIEGLAKLKPLLGPKGTVTAGNACGINDGAGALVIASKEAASRFGLTLKARFVASAVTGVAPRVMGLGPIPSSKMALAKAGLKMSDMDVIEISEAFAAQVVASLRGMGVPEDAPHVNPNGGSIAIGHPLGASGARLLMTAMYELKRTTKRYALCTMCIGVGQGIAVILERV